jgi:hypothetical protein
VGANILEEYTVSIFNLRDGKSIFVGNLHSLYTATHPDTTPSTARTTYKKKHKNTTVPTYQVEHITLKTNTRSCNRKLLLL